MIDENMNAEVANVVATVAIAMAGNAIEKAPKKIIGKNVAIHRRGAMSVRYPVNGAKHCTFQ